jgi:hypothetical protein
MTNKEFSSYGGVSCSSGMGQDLSSSRVIECVKKIKKDEILTSHNTLLRMAEWVDENLRFSKSKDSGCKKKIITELQNRK